MVISKLIRKISDMVLLYLPSMNSTGIVLVNPDKDPNADQSIVDMSQQKANVNDRPKLIQTECVIRVIRCVLLLSIIPIMIGVLTYLIISGESMMDDSHGLVIPVDVMAMSRSTSVRGQCGKGACTTLYATTVRYTFNNQTKQAPYTSTTPYSTGDNFTITISKSSGIPLRSKETELYHDGYARHTAGIVCIIIFMLWICPGIIICTMECAKHK